MYSNLVCVIVYLLRGLCQGQQPVHKSVGYKVLLQGLLPGSLHSLESAVHVWRIVETWKAHCWKMILFAHALLLWRWLFSWLLYLTNGPWLPANHMLKGTRHSANFQKVLFAPTFISQLRTVTLNYTFYRSIFRVSSKKLTKKGLAQKKPYSTSACMQTRLHIYIQFTVQNRAQAQSAETNPSIFLQKKTNW